MIADYHRPDRFGHSRERRLLPSIADWIALAVHASADYRRLSPTGSLRPFTRAPITADPIADYRRLKRCTAGSDIGRIN